MKAGTDHEYGVAYEECPQKGGLLPQPIKYVVMLSGREIEELVNSLNRNGSHTQTSANLLARLKEKLTRITNERP